MGGRTRNSLNKEMRRTTDPASATGGGGVAFDYPAYASANFRAKDDALRPSTAPIPSPTTGLKYIVPGYGSGAWAGHIGTFATYGASSWAFTIPAIGTRVYVDNEFHHSNFIRVLGPNIEANSLTGVEDGRINGGSYGPGERSSLDVVADPITNGQYHIFAWAPEIHIDALRSLFRESVVNATTTAPPGSPAEYSRYIVASVATGAWAGKENYLAFAVADTYAQAMRWIFVKPKAGALVYNVATGKWMWYNGTALAWQNLGSNIATYDLSDFTGAHTVAENGYVLTYDGGTGLTSWQPVPTGGTHALNDHTDTVLGAPGAPQDGYYVGWDNGTTKYTLKAPTGLTAHTLGSATHTDVILTAPAQGQYLGYNAGTSKWNNMTIPTPLFDSLSNVNFTGKAAGDSVKWTGATWIKWTPVLADMSDVTATVPTIGQALVWNGAAWSPGSITATLPSGTGRVVALTSNVAGQANYDLIGGVRFYQAIFGSGGGTNYTYFKVPSGYTKARVTVSKQESGRIYVIRITPSSGVPPADLPVISSSSTFQGDLYGIVTPAFNVVAGDYIFWGYSGEVGIYGAGHVVESMQLELFT